MEATDCARLLWVSEEADTNPLRMLCFVGLVFVGLVFAGLAFAFAGLLLVGLGLVGLTRRLLAGLWVASASVGVGCSVMLGVGVWGGGVVPWPLPRLDLAGVLKSTGAKISKLGIRSVESSDLDD